MFQTLASFLFQHQSIRQTIAKNTFWLAFGEIVGRLLRAGIVIYATRILGPVEWGVFSYALSLAALFMMFSEIGLGVILVREGAKSAEALSRFFATTSILKLGLVTISFFAILWGAPLVSKFPLSQMLITGIALLVIFDSFRGFGTSFFRAIEKMEREALVNIFTQAVTLAAGFVMLERSTSPEALAAAYAVGTGGGLLLTIYFLKSYIKEIFSRFSTSLLIPIFRAAWPISIAGVLGIIMLNVDTIMIGFFRGAAEVGFYAAAQKPIVLLYMFPSLIAGSFFPVLARFARKDDERFRRVLEQGLRVVFLAALPATIVVFLTAQEVITLLYGQAYFPAAAPLRILALTLLTTFPMSLVIYAIFAYDRQKELILFGSLGAASNIILNFIFIPVWGIVGAAWATLLAQLINNGLIWFRMQTIQNFSVLPKLRNVSLATFVTALAVAVFQQIGLPILATLSLAALTYVTILIVLKEDLLRQVKAILEG